MFAGFVKLYFIVLLLLQVMTALEGVSYLDFNLEVFIEAVSTFFN